MSSCKKILPTLLLSISLLLLLVSSIISIVIVKKDSYAVYKINGYNENQGKTFVVLKSKEIEIDNVASKSDDFTYITSCNYEIENNSKCGNFTGFESGMKDAKTRVLGSMITNWFTLLYPFVFIILQIFISIHNCCLKKHKNQTFLYTFFRLSLILCTISSFSTSLIMSYGFNNNNIIKGTTGITFEFQSNVSQALSWASFAPTIISSILVLISFIVSYHTYRKHKHSNNYKTILK